MKYSADINQPGEVVAQKKEQKYTDDCYDDLVLND